MPFSSSENSYLELSIVVSTPFSDLIVFSLYIRFSQFCLFHAGNVSRAQRMTGFP
jgi:hypothetical protein